MKGIEYLRFIADIYGVDKKDREERVRDLTRRFGIQDVLNQMIRTYSHGMKQKLALIAALVHSPKLLVLDEPFVGLDPKASFTLKEIMKDMCAHGCSIFFSTHVLEVAEKLCNKVAIIREGKLLTAGGINEVRGNASLESTFLELTDDSAKN